MKMIVGRGRIVKGERHKTEVGRGKETFGVEKEIY